MQGIIVIDKPEGYTSHDVIAVMRRLTGVKRIGHTGTLDPMATGVLVVCIGRATRIMEYLESDSKEYECTMKLGIITDTEDIWGTPIRETPENGNAGDDNKNRDPEKSALTESENVAGLGIENLNNKSLTGYENISDADNPGSGYIKCASDITGEMIEKAAEKFRGDIWQYPPKYSAVKVAGRKLYQYARAGEEVEIKPRRVTISKLEVTGRRADEIDLKITCSRGTYVRTICSDMGRELGCGAVMSRLRRTRSGCYTLEHAISIEALREMTPEEIERHLRPMDEPLTMPQLDISLSDAKDIANGKHINLPIDAHGDADETDAEETGDLRGQKNGSRKEAERQLVSIYTNGTFVGVAERMGTELIADKIFRTKLDENI